MHTEPFRYTGHDTLCLMYCHQQKVGQIFVFNCFWMNKNHIWERKAAPTVWIKQQHTDNNSVNSHPLNMPRLISQQGSKQQWVQQRPKTSVTKEHLQSWILLLCCRPYCKLCSWLNEWPNQKPIHYEQSKTTTWFPELFLTLFGHQWVFSDAMHSNERSDQCLVMSTSIYSPGGFCTTIKHSSFDSFSFEYMW